MNSKLRFSHKCPIEGKKKILFLELPDLELSFSELEKRIRHSTVNNIALFTVASLINFIMQNVTECSSMLPSFRITAAVTVGMTY